MHNTENYTLGKGKILFQPAGTNGFIDFGNAPNFSVSQTVEKLDHFDSRVGMQVKDASQNKKITAAGKFTLDEPNITNLNFFIMGDVIADISQTSGNLTLQPFTARKDKWISLGKRKLSSVVVKDATDAITYVLNTDYVLDASAGLLMALSTGAIADAAILHVSCSYAASTIKRADGGTKAGWAGDLWFVGNPPRGKVTDIKGYVNLSPEGDMPMIGEDWQSFGFTVEFLENTNYNGVPEFHDRGVV